MQIAWRAFLLMSCVLGPVGFAGCAFDECDTGEVTCIDNAVAHCIHQSCHTPGCTARNSWVTDAPCSHACVEAGGSAFCVLSTEPSPECGESQGGYCDGSASVRCKLGYAMDRRDCAEQGHACYEHGMGIAAYPLCAFPGLEDPRCQVDSALQPQSVLEWASGAVGSYCDGSRLMTCRGLVVDDVRECASACVDADEGDAFCASSANPDPLCQDREMAEAPLNCPDGSAALCRKDGYLECLDANEPVDPDAGQPATEDRSGTRG